MPSYIIRLVTTNGEPAKTGVRYTDETDREKVQALVRERLRKIPGALDKIAYISVDPSNLPAERDL
jgi:hypothetical protein